MRHKFYAEDGVYSVY